MIHLRLSSMTRFQLIGVDFGNVLRIVVPVGRANRAKLRRSCKGAEDANRLWFELHWPYFIYGEILLESLLAFAWRI
jgi:hypothetical protein